MWTLPNQNKTGGFPVRSHSSRSTFPPADSSSTLSFSLSLSRVEGCQVTHPPRFLETRPLPSPPAAPWPSPTCRRATVTSSRRPLPSCRTSNPTWPACPPLLLQVQTHTDKHTCVSSITDVNITVMKTLRLGITWPGQRWCHRKRADVWLCWLPVNR